MAQFSCTLEEFNRIIGPKIRNDVQYVTKKPKGKLGLVCQHCGNKFKELEAEAIRRTGVADLEKLASRL